MTDNFIHPDWPAPSNIKAVMTTRLGGVSKAPFDSLNLGDHVNDDPTSVQTNRELLAAKLKLPGHPIWLTQVHGKGIAKCETAKDFDKADAIVGTSKHSVCAIMTADCLPVLFCNKQGTKIAAAHAGWRGLASGVLEEAISAMSCNREDILVWLGAAIGPNAFEVGAEVKEAFVNINEEAVTAFQEKGESKWLADIYTLARIRLQSAGMLEENIYGGDMCTYNDADKFYSYRRESRTGRMAALIWRE